MKRAKGNGTPPAEVPATTQHEALPAIIDRARAKLAEARTSAEVLEAKEVADFGLHVAKLQHAADEVHADCVLLIAEAERRIGGEIIAGKESGELAPGHRPKKGSDTSTLSQIGISKDQSAQYQDTARTPPEVVEKAVRAEVDAGKAPTKATVRRAVRAHKATAKKTTRAKKPKGASPDARKWIHDGVGIDAGRLRRHYDGLTVPEREQCVESLKAIRAVVDQVISGLEEAAP